MYLKEFSTDGYLFILVLPSTIVSGRENGAPQRLLLPWKLLLPEGNLNEQSASVVRPAVSVPARIAFPD
jgi:hypothetical protein